MFVRNCVVNRNERYRIPEENNKRNKKNKNNKNINNNNNVKDPKLIESKNEEKNIKNNDGNQNYYYPVLCKYCQTQVGLLDQNEIYHLFNVIPSDF